MNNRLLLMVSVALTDRTRTADRIAVALVAIFCFSKLHAAPDGQPLTWLKTANYSALDGYLTELQRGYESEGCPSANSTKAFGRSMKMGLTTHDISIAGCRRTRTRMLLVRHAVLLLPHGVVRPWRRAHSPNGAGEDSRDARQSRAGAAGFARLVEDDHQALLEYLVLAERYSIGWF
jgi:hypothetical protein